MAAALPPVKVLSGCAGVTPSSSSSTFFHLPPPLSRLSLLFSNRNSLCCTQLVQCYLFSLFCVTCSNSYYMYLFIYYHWNIKNNGINTSAMRSGYVWVCMCVCVCVYVCVCVPLSPSPAPPPPGPDARTHSSPS